MSSRWHLIVTFLLLKLFSFNRWALGGFTSCGFTHPRPVISVGKVGSGVLRRWFRKKRWCLREMLMWGFPAACAFSRISFSPRSRLFPALSLEKKKTKNILALLIRLAFESWKPCCRCEKSNISCFIDVPDWCSHNSALRWFLKCRRQPLQFSVKGGKKKLVLFCIFPIVPWENTIKYELVLFSVLSDYLTWSGALSLRPIGSHRRQGSFQTGVNRQFIRNYFQQWINSHFPSAGRMQADVEPTVLIIMKTNVTPTQS